MRSRAVIPAAAALVWLISIEGAAARLDILVDKTTQRMLVIQDGYVRYMWPVSTGRDNMATPNGLYAPERLERNWFSRAYYNSPMPYSIFFHNGYAIHGSYAINQLGGPASHGCVRLHPYHAALLFDLVQHEGPQQTTIEVTEEGRPEQPPFRAREIAPGQGRNWPIAARNPLPPQFRPPANVPPSAANHVLQQEDPDETATIEATNESRPKERWLPRREIAPGPGANRPIAARSPWPPSRRMTDLRPPPNGPRAPSGAANPAPRAAIEPPDPRPKPKIAEASPPEPAQQAGPVSAFKLLPASCWSGGASRWRWWASSKEAPCK